MKKNILLIYVITCLFLGTCITTTYAIDTVKKSSIQISNGNTLYVGGTGEGNYSKIQDAIDNASEGDTIFVYNGTYFEYIKIDKSINLIGENKDTVIINGINEYYDVIYIEEVNNLTISGFTIQNSGYNDQGIELNEACNNIIYDNIIKNNYLGIMLNYKCNNNSIYDNYFINNGLYIWNSYQNIVSNNYVNGKPLIYLESNYNKVIEDDAGQIILVDCNNITIRNQDISNASLAIELFQTDNCSIYNNILHSNIHGLYLQYSDYNNIYENSFNGNYVGLGLFDFSDYNTVIDTEISNNTGCGVAFDHSQYNTIKGNIIENNGFIDPSYYVGGINFGLHARNNNIINNYISNNYNGIVEITGYRNYISKNRIMNNANNGIFLSDWSSNTEIVFNHIEGNGNFGIYIEESQHKISNNNFINNTKNIFFEYLLFDGNKVRWSGNYYDDYKGFGFKLIWGKMRYEFGQSHGYPIWSGSFAWFNIDWNPAKEPYDIL